MAMTDAEARPTAVTTTVILPHHIAQEHWRFLHAFEDLDAATRRKLADRGIDTSETLWQRLRDLGGAALGLGQNILGSSKEGAEILWDLRRAFLTPYTYFVDLRLVRGSRPSRQKLRDLCLYNGIGSAINLCSEMPYGDQELLTPELVGRLQLKHIPVIDDTPPSMEQIVDFLKFVSEPSAARAYVHCEAGVGRTGVMVACYRLAVSGWHFDDALDEAKRFGCRGPGQQVRVKDFYEALRDDAIGWRRPEDFDSVAPTEAQAVAAPSMFRDPGSLEQ